MTACNKNLTPKGSSSNSVSTEAAGGALTAGNYTKEHSFPHCVRSDGGLKNIKYQTIYSRLHLTRDKVCISSQIGKESSVGT